MLKKGQKVYYDRDSVYFRGPFVFQRLTRGSLLNFTVRDAGYDIVYNFVIKPSQLEKETLYAVTQNWEKQLKENTILCIKQDIKQGEKKNIKQGESGEKNIKVGENAVRADEKRGGGIAGDMMIISLNLFG